MPESWIKKVSAKAEIHNLRGKSFQNRHKHAPIISALFKVVICDCMKLSARLIKLKILTRLLKASRYFSLVDKAETFVM